jgi:hypothetical protein
MKRVVTVALSLTMVVAASGTSHATGLTKKATNVAITGSGVQSGELSVSWVNPNTFDVGHVGFQVNLRSSTGVIVDTETIESLTATSFVFRSLTNDAAYSAEVATLYETGSLLEIGNEAAKPYDFPSAPVKPTVSRTGSGELFVDWDIPANNGNPISSYSITCVPGCPVSPLTTPNSEVTIAGLLTATSYVVTVTATNARGNSVASVASDSITPHANVVAPSNLAITAGDARATTSWTAPTISGAVVSGYTVQIFKESEPTSPKGSQIVTGTSATFTGLENGSRYFFKVSTKVGTITSAPATSLLGLTAATVIAPAPAPNPPSQINGPSPSTDTGTNSPAGNTPAPAAAPAPAAQPTSKVKQRTPGASLATQIGMTVTPKAKIKLTVAKASKKICKVSGGRLVALKPGNCSVTVSVTPAKTKAVKKPKATKQSTVVAIS